MTGMISNILGKSLAIPKLASYALGATSVHKLGCLGYRAVSCITSSLPNHKLKEKISDKLSLVFNPYVDSDSSIKLLNEKFNQF